MSSSRFRWVWRGPAGSPPQSESPLPRVLGISPVLAAVLLARGLTDEERGRRFLAPRLDHLAPPDLLPDLGPATERVARAVRERERVAVVGHDDLDGISSAVIMTSLLEALGLETAAYIPHRPSEGYGVTPGVVEYLARQGTDLLVVVDFGVSSYEGVALARDRGIDSIIIDHHEPPPELPGAVAVVDPKRSDSRYPFRELAGVGLAYRVLEHWAEELPPLAGPGSREKTRAELDSALELVALGTLADRVPLVEENRVLVAGGVARVGGTRRPGLAAALAAVGSRGRHQTARGLGSRLVPLLNAGVPEKGRHPAFDLLSTNDHAKAREALEKLRRERDAWGERAQRALDLALSRAEEKGTAVTQRALVVADRRLPIDVLGFCAGRLADKYCRPAVVVSRGVEEAVGQIRGPGAVDLLAGLESAAELFTGFGGHRQAAGFSLPSPRVEELAGRLVRYFDQALTEDDLTRSLAIDAELPLSGIDDHLAQELGRLEPVGAGNGPPVFLARSVGWKDVVELTEGGSRTGHVELKGSDEHDGLVELLRWSGEEQDVLYTMEARSRDRVVLEILDVAELKS